MALPSIQSDVCTFIVAFVLHWQNYVTGGVVTGGISVWERLTKKTIPVRFYIWIFVVTFSVAGFFSAWREQYQRAITAEESLLDTKKSFDSLTTPRFSAVIDQIDLAERIVESPSGRDLGPSVLVWVTISNKGAESIARNFQMTVKTNDGKTQGLAGRKLPPTMHAGSLALRAEGQEIFDKTAETPIPHNGAKSGMALYLLGPVNVDNFKVLGTIYDLQFEDINGTIWHAKHTMRGGASEQFRYVPGSTILAPK